MSEERGTGARIGVTFLNLLVSGLGLIRIGQLRLGFGLFATHVALLAALYAIPFSIGRFSFVLLAIIVVIGLLQIALWIAGMVLTFKRSRERRETGPLSRWPTLLAMTLAVWTLTYLRPSTIGPFRVFSIPSESMVPQFEIGDRIVVDTRRREPKRGAVMVFRMEEGQWVFRVAGLPGDRVSMRDGVVSINGAAITQEQRGTFTLPETHQFGSGNDRPVMRLIERFPGETGSHSILDMKMGFSDNVEELVVPAGQVFLLGDNRDNAADSRFGRSAIGGPGLVPVDDLIGTVDFIYWSPKPEHRFKSIEAVAITVDQGN